MSGAENFFELVNYFRMLFRDGQMGKILQNVFVLIYRSLQMTHLHLNEILYFLTR